MTYPLANRSNLILPGNFITKWMAALRLPTLTEIILAVIGLAAAIEIIFGLVMFVLTYGTDPS